MRRRGFVAVALAALLALSGCAGLPMSGAVHEGMTATVDPDMPAVDYKPQPPANGATPAQIVDGFIRAAASPDGNWSVARQYLAPLARSTWQPDAGVTIDVLSARSMLVASQTSTQASVQLSITAAASVDATGAYTPGGAATAPISYSVGLQSDGQWRITTAPNGILLDEGLFTDVFHAYPLMYFDPTWQYLVPDLRWFPTLNAATRVTAALVGGQPSPWLKGSVVTAFAETVSLARPSVPIVSGVAQVELKDTVLGVDATTQARMQAQLQASLAGVGQVTSVVMSVGGASLEATAAPVRSTRIDPRAMVDTASAFGFASGDQITPIPGLSDRVHALAPTAVELSADQTLAALRTSNGAIIRVTSSASTVVDNTGGFVAPTIDPENNIWSASASDPTGVVVISPGGTRTTLPAPWTGVSQLDAFQLSRDGTRLAALLVIGGRTQLVVSAVQRDAQGVPRALGEPLTLLTLAGDGIDVGWLDDDSLGTLSLSGTTTSFTTVQVGGLSVTADAPANAVTVTLGTFAGVARVRDSTGVVYIRRGTSWQQQVSGTRLLATQQGQPSN